MTISLFTHTLLTFHIFTSVHLGRCASDDDAGHKWLVVKELKRVIIFGLVQSKMELGGMVRVFGNMVKVIKSLFGAGISEYTA